MFLWVHLCSVTYWKQVTDKCIIIILSEKFAAQPEVPLYYIPFLERFGRIISCLEQGYVFSLKEGFPRWTKVTHLSVSLLTHPFTTLQLWGYKMLLALIPGFIEVDSLSLVSNKPHEKGFALENFREVLLRTQDITQTMLLEFRYVYKCDEHF